MSLTTSRHAGSPADAVVTTRDAPPPTRAAAPWALALWWLAVVVATAVLVAARVTSVPLISLPFISAPLTVVPLASATITAAFGVALIHRTGDRSLVGLVVGLGLGVAAAATDVPVLDAGVALATAVLTGTLAVLVTQPAANLLRAVREIVAVTVLSGVGALAVAGYAPTVVALRFRYLAVVVALAVVVGLVSKLGSGLHGAGRRGAIALVVGTAILVAAVAYGEALTRWGSPVLIDGIVHVRGALRDLLGAVPHPIETLLGFPALTWGVFMRARRLQGWWVSVFGVAATASTASALVDPSVTELRAALGSLYSLVLGVAIGYAIIRVDLYWTGPRGSRARRDEAAHAVRPEPGRTRALR